ncbi:MAG: hypothetical protein NXH85_14685 [Pseudomonadaceae bacterium]|nr:hypothetical protein [Pseudomonadaceae bacterium]
MQAFRTLLVVIFATIAIYTVFVVAEHGMGLLPVFFGDILKMGWPGQFNLDFLGFLMLSGFWLAWRNHFTPAGLALGVGGFFLGAPFLTAYLLFVSFRCGGDVREMLLGAQRAQA